MKIAIVQFNPVWESIDSNLKKIENMLNQELSDQVDIIVLPEMFSTGFSMNTSLAETENGKSVNWMKSISEKYSSAICGSVMTREDSHYYNRFYWIHRTDLFTYDKRHLFSLAQEHLDFSAGDQNIEIEYKGFKIRSFICYDLRFPVWMRNKNAADLDIVVANFPKTRTLAWDTLLRARAIENQNYVIGVNIVGKDGNGLEYSGHSAVYDCEGLTVAHCNSGEGVFVVQINQERITAFRRAYPFWKDADQFEINRTQNK